MSGDYISREAVLAQKGDCYDKDGHLLYAVGTGNVLRIPAADVVEVVRCRECIYYHNCTCDRWADGTFMEPTDYCSRAARMDGGQGE